MLLSRVYNSMRKLIKGVRDTRGSFGDYISLTVSGMVLLMLVDMGVSLQAMMSLHNNLGNLSRIAALGMENSGCLTFQTVSQLNTVADKGYINPQQILIINPSTLPGSPAPYGSSLSINLEYKYTPYLFGVPMQQVLVKDGDITRSEYIPPSSGYAPDCLTGNVGSGISLSSAQ